MYKNIEDVLEAMAEELEREERKAAKRQRRIAHEDGKRERKASIRDKREAKDWAFAQWEI